MNEMSTFIIKLLVIKAWLLALEEQVLYMEKKKKKQ